MCAAHTIHAIINHKELAKLKNERKKRRKGRNHCLLEILHEGQLLLMTSFPLLTSALKHDYPVIFRSTRAILQEIHHLRAYPVLGMSSASVAQLAELCTSYGCTSDAPSDNCCHLDIWSTCNLHLLLEQLS